MEASALSGAVRQAMLALSFQKAVPALAVLITVTSALCQGNQKAQVVLGQP